MFVKAFGGVYNASGAVSLTFTETLQEMFFNKDPTEVNRLKP
jgi:hypothetical protein